VSSANSCLLPRISQYAHRVPEKKFLLRLLKHLARGGEVTLLCHCASDEAHCHRHLLRSIILSRRV